jgi:hypothetical protein
LTEVVEQSGVPVYPVMEHLDTHQRCPASFQLVIDRAVLLADALLLFDHDPIQENRFTCSAKVLATRFRSNGQA